MTGTEVVKVLKQIKKNSKFGIQKIIVSIGEFEEGFDIYCNVWYSDRWGNDDFKDITLTTVDEEKVAMTKGKRLTTTIENNGFKATFAGIENC